MEEAIWRFIHLKKEYGKIYLSRCLCPQYGHFMFKDYCKEIEEKKITTVIRLLSLEEVEERDTTKDYYNAIKNDKLEWNEIVIPIEDYNPPNSIEEVKTKLEEVSQFVKKGENILIHCGAGHGRTGMIAILLLYHLGYDKEEAKKIVLEAGSAPETELQRQFIREYVIYSS